MNATQLKYARERARRIFDEKAAALREKLKAPNPNMEFKLNALRKGEFKVDKIGDGRGYGLESYIIWTGLPNNDPKAYAKAYAELEKQYRALTDELMLGDNQVALELLKAFEAA